MVTSVEIKDGLGVWAVQHGVLSDEGLLKRLGQHGDPNLIPFDETHAEFFKTRKITNITAARYQGRDLITVSSRLGIAITKMSNLKQVFADKWGNENFHLRFTVERSFKIDQSIPATYNPVYSNTSDNGHPIISCGSSIGLGNQRNAGTLMAIGESKEFGLVGISCNHVTGGCNTADRGTPIVCPGIQDVISRTAELTLIGRHSFTAPMSQGLPDILPDVVANNCDISFFQIDDEQAQRLSSMQGEGDNAYDTPVKFASIGNSQIKVKKWGRTTGFTRGLINRIVTDPEPIDYKITSYFGPASSQIFNGTVYFKDFYEVEPFGTEPFHVAGDSGSLVVTDTATTEKIVGILIGGTDKKPYRTFVLPIKTVLKKLGVTLIANHNI